MNTFDSHSWYIIFNKENRPGQTLRVVDGNGAVGMGTFLTDGTENWQIYYQQQRWYIRTLAKELGQQTWVEYQLGLTKESSTVPKMLKRDGSLGQQWTFTEVDDGNGGLLYKISNGLSGNKTCLSLPASNGTPGMQTSSGGALWDLQVNPGAGTPEHENFYRDVVDLEVPSTPSATPPPTTSSSTTFSTSQTSSTSSTSTSSSTTETPPRTSAANISSVTISPGGMAGIAIGIVSFVLVAALGVYFYLSRRKSKKAAAHNTKATTELDGSSQTVDPHVFKPVEIGSAPMIHIAQERQYQELRYEM
ncbi:unnamed protein product [Periconia digitata]|uniref:Ricin B lectin domain-containing protein n=1 Tax=Periconia digitata TaxID=1303443 RepID=A0A9W4UB42_9PLEO|nr:unnamed protein product [Periconia digitata]